MSTEQQIALRVAERLREIATRQGHIPFRTGDLRKSVIVRPYGPAGAVVGSNLPYARAVHDGRPALVIRPKSGKALKFTVGGKEVFAKKVFQKARKGVPFLRDAVEEMRREGLSWLAPSIGEDLAARLGEALRRGGIAIDGR